MLPAGGAPEIELCQQLQKFGRKETGLDQYAIAKFAESLEVTPLPETTGAPVCCTCRITHMSMHVHTLFNFADAHGLLNEWHAPLQLVAVAHAVT